MSVTSVKVKLGPDEVRIAEQLGSERFGSCRRAGSPDVHYTHDRTSEAQDQHAVGAELAVASYLGLYPRAFSSIGSNNKGGDVGVFQVRHTKHLHGSLLIYEESADDQVFIFVVGQLPEFQLVGWIKAGEAKTSDRWQTVWPNEQPMQKPCWIVRQDDPIINDVSIPHCATRRMERMINVVIEEYER